MLCPRKMQRTQNFHHLQWAWSQAYVSARLRFA